MKKIKMFMGAVLCMNLLTLSGCDRIVQSAVVEEKDQTEQKKEEKKETVQKSPFFLPFLNRLHLPPALLPVHPLSG